MAPRSLPRATFSSAFDDTHLPDSIGKRNRLRWPRFDCPAPLRQVIPMQPSVYAIATMDTKGEEITFVARRLEEAGALVTVVDVGTQGPATSPSAVPRDAVAACHPKGASF